MDDLATIIRQAQVGDAAAFRVLVERFHTMAVQTCYAVLGDWQLAEDAAQEAFLALHCELPDLHAPPAFTAWFHTILRKYCDRQTRRAQRPTVSLVAAEQIAGGDDPVEALTTQEEADRVRVALHSLPEPEHTIALQFYVEHAPQAAIAAALGVPVQTVKNRLFAARRRLRSQLTNGAAERERSSAPGQVRGREAGRERGMRLFARYATAPAHDPVLLHHAIADLATAVDAGDRRLETLQTLHDALYAQGDLVGIVNTCGSYGAVAASPAKVYWARERVAVAYAQLGYKDAAAREHGALIGQLRRVLPPETLLQSFAIGEIVQTWAQVGALDMLDATRVSLAAVTPRSTVGDEARALALRTYADVLAHCMARWEDAAREAVRLLEWTSAGSWPTAPAVATDARGVLLAAAIRWRDDRRAADALEGALADIARIDEATPRFVRCCALHDFGMRCLSLGLYGEARRLLQEALALRGSPETALWLSAALLHTNGDRALARAHFQFAVCHPRLSLRHHLALMFRTDPLWAPARHAPHFRAILRAAISGTSQITTAP
jgi:RNA polymerase sigma-70 factor, ECF subfamily